SLEELELSHSSLPSNYIQVFGPLISLKKLTTSGIDGNNSPPMHDVCEFTNLQELDMRACNKKGSLPVCFSNLTSLKILYLSYNQFSGNISILKSLKLLEYLDLSSNQFSGNISALESLTSLQSLAVPNNKFHIPSSLRPLFNLSKLKELYAYNNTIHDDDHERSHSSTPRFQLNSISLSCRGSGVSFPQFLYHQSELQYVDLSNTYFKVDRFLFWLLDNNTMLRTLSLVNCSLSGPFQNCFNGRIPSSFGDMSSLQVLDLSNNQLSGEIPEQMAMACSSLQVLALSNNILQGSIFSRNFNLTSLSELELNGNN
ncbi:hypothetical protein Gotur_018162, partial [Gossypium turneri]